MIRVVSQHIFCNAFGEHYKVPEKVLTYIRQLESKIKFGFDEDKFRSGVGDWIDGDVLEDSLSIQEI